MSHPSLVTCYKVVSSTPTGLKSAILNTEPSNDTTVINLSYKYGINYRTQRWVNPKLVGSKIFVFDTLDNASAFVRRENFCKQYPLHIYKCYAKNPKIISQIPFCGRMVNFWLQHKNQFLATMCAPCGTYICDSVFLFERVE